MNQPYRALAVEDDADSLALMRVVLTGLPLEIDHVETGADAIAYLQQQVPDLMFLDINLPDMRGWDILDRFKNDQRLTNLHIIVLTSHHEPVHRLIGMLQPIAAYLRKPVEAETLRQHVRQFMVR